MADSMAQRQPLTLRAVLGECARNGGFALSLSPGFFRFYALMGACRVLEEESLLDFVTHMSGSSAGALVGGFLSAGLLPSSLHDVLMNLHREDIWDVGGIGGLLRGNLFHAQLEKHLPVKTFEECSRKLGVTAYDMLRFRTTKVTTGDLATAIRASCTFPLMFQPVWLENSYHIDGGVWDDSGLMALPGVPASNTIVNIVCDRSRLKSSIIPDHLPNNESIRLVTVVLDNIPMVTPFTLSQGPVAFEAAMAAVRSIFDTELSAGTHENHFVVIADASNVSPAEGGESQSTKRMKVEGTAGDIVVATAATVDELSAGQIENKENEPEGVVEITERKRKA